MDIPTDTPPVEVPVPDDLAPEEREVWDALAPHAREARTMTPATAARFRLLCQQIVTERKMAATIEKDGLTYVTITIDGSGQERETLKAHPLCSPHRGMMQRIETGILAFKLAPQGRRMAAPAQEKRQSALVALQARRPGISGSGLVSDHAAGEAAPAGTDDAKPASPRA